MTLDKLRIYYNAVVGAGGGLLGWALITLLLRFSTDSTFGLFVKDALLGALVGACIGAAVGSVEQFAGSLDLRKLGGRQARQSALIGLVAGTAGLVIGETIFLLAGGGVWPRALGWALFGALLGAGQWRVTGMPSKGTYGALGGALGGLIGGATYERLSLLLRGLGLGREAALTVGGAVGLMILGACIALLMGLVENILRRAWLRFTQGPPELEGQTRTLDPQRATTTLGRADHCDIMLRRDPQATPLHAEIRRQNHDFVIVARDGPVLLHGPDGQTPVQQHTLHEGDTLQLGRTRFVFHTSEESLG